MTIRSISTVHNNASMIVPTSPRAAAWMVLASIPLAVTIVGEARQAASPAAQPADFFETRVRPVLASNCYDCHTDTQMGGLRLDSREALLKGGRSGPAVVPGDPEKSLLIQAVRQTSEKLKMPKGGHLRPDEIDVLTEWVKAGAAWPSFAGASTARTSAPASASADGKATATADTSTAASAPAYVIKPEQRAFWSFQPLRKPPVPAVSHASWPKTEIDRFVLARLEKEGLAPARAADTR